MSKLTALILCIVGLVMVIIVANQCEADRQEIEMLELKLEMATAKYDHCLGEGL